MCIVYKVFRPSGVVGFREVGWQRCTGEISDVDVSRYRFFPEKMAVTIDAALQAAVFPAWRSLWVKKQLYSRRGL